MSLEDGLILHCAGQQRFHNSFGRKAQQCRYLKDPGFAFGTGDFSISFWIHTQLCGLSNRPKTHFALQSGLRHFNRMENSGDYGFEEVPALGGVVIANKDCSKAGNKGFSINAMPYQRYLDVDFCSSSMGGFWQALDDRWHMVCVVFDRDAQCVIHIDGQWMGAFDISASKGIDLDTGTIVLGADLNGDWGFQNGTLMDVRIHNRVVGGDEIQEWYYLGAMPILIAEIHQRLPLCSRYCSTGSLASMRLVLDAAAKSPPDKTNFNSLTAAYENFLLGDHPKAVFGMISDIHMLPGKPMAAAALEQAIADLGALRPRVDGLIIGGDVSHDSSAKAIDHAWRILRGALEKTSIDKVTIAVGNHELWLGGEGSYAEGMPAFQRNIRQYRDDRQTTPDYYRNHMAGYTFLVLNCEQPLDNRYTRHQTHLTDTQLAWLDENLRASQELRRPVFVMLHQPFEDTFPLTDAASGDWAVGAEDARLRSILGKYRNAIHICGHMHQPFNVAPIFMVDGSFPSIQIPGLDFTPKNFCIPGSGYVMFIYDGLILLRARDLVGGRWLPIYDKAVILQDNFTVQEVVNTLSGEQNLWNCH